MKRTILTILAAMGMALGVFAQGAFVVDNLNCAGGIVVNGTSGTSLSGFGYLSGGSPAGLEVWYLNGTSFTLNTINQYNVGGGNPSAAYAALSANSFTLATSFANKPINLGGFSLGQLNIPGVTAAGSAITVAIAAWDGSGSSFAGGAHEGVLAFTIPTVDYTAQPPPTAKDLTTSTGQGGSGPGGFNSFDLVLNAPSQVPEPSTFALAGLGAAALLIFRRRK